MRSCARALLLLCLVALCGSWRTPGGAGRGPDVSASPSPAPPAPEPPPPPEAATPPQPGDDPVEPCRALRPLREMVIRSPADDDRAQAAVERCVATGALEGLTRAQSEAILGPGQPSSGMFESFGIQADDVFYEIGRFATPVPGGVPNLVLDFDAGGRCTRALAIHTM